MNELNDLIQIGKLIRVTAKDSDGRKFSFFSKPSTKSTLLGASVRIYQETDRDGAPTQTKRIIQECLIEKEQPLGLSKTYGKWVFPANNACQAD